VDDVQMTLVGPMFGQYVHFMRFAPKGNDYSLDRYRTQVRRVLTTLQSVEVGHPGWANKAVPAGWIRRIVDARFVMQ
jgi:hypothetical protein